MDNEFMIEYEKINKRNKILVIILIVVIALLTIVLGSVFFLKITYNKILFTNSFDYVYENIFKDLGKENTNIFKGKKQINTSLTLSPNLSEEYKQSLELNDLESLGLNMLIQLDEDSKESFYDMNYLENNESILNLKMYSNKTDSYVNYSNLFDKVVKLNEKVDLTDTITDSQKDINYKELSNIVYLTKEIIVNNIDNSHIVKEHENVAIEESSYKLDKYLYKLKGEEYKEFLIKIYTDIKSNEELVNTLTNYTGNTETELLSSIDSLIDEANSITNEELELNIYTTGLFRKIVGFEILSISNMDEYNIKFIMIEDKIKLELIDSIDVITIEGHKEQDIVKLTYLNNYELTANIVIKKVGNTYDIILSDPKNTFSVKFNIYSLKEKDTETLNTFVEFTTSDNTVNIKLDFKIEIKSIDTIASFDYSNAVEEDKLTEEDNATISNNLMTELGKSKLFGLIFNSFSEQVM